MRLQSSRTSSWNVVAPRPYFRATTSLPSDFFFRKLSVRGAPQTSGCASALDGGNGFSRALPRLTSGPGPHASVQLGGAV
eukprot:1647004-Alexandrium_andersonii.AAC.1